jgi:hypothetical protein
MIEVIRETTHAKTATNDPSHHDRRRGRWAAVGYGHVRVAGCEQ